MVCFVNQVFSTLKYDSKIKYEKSILHLILHGAPSSGFKPFENDTQVMSHKWFIRKQVSHVDTQPEIASMLGLRPMGLASICQKKILYCL